MLSAAIVASGILISSRLRNTYKLECFSSLMYFETFYFTFGFYAICGQVILVSLLSQLITGELMSRTTTFLTLLGTPFIVFTWLMLLRFTMELSGRDAHSKFITTYLLSFAMLITGIYYLFPLLSVIDPFTIMKYGFMVINFTYTVTAVVILLAGKRKKAILRRIAMQQIAAGLLINMLLQNVILIFYQGNVYIAMAFILTYFIGGAFVPVYIRYKTDISRMISSSGSGFYLDDFCRNFDISARERDIIREVCQGLSNQQIADKLFITLQTVKDHTSRIYDKTNCNSRAQLITMVKK
jgi:DNA-binding CsgD family transcriptional regulator